MTFLHIWTYFNYIQAYWVHWTGASTNSSTLMPTWSDRAMTSVNVVLSSIFQSYTYAESRVTDSTFFLRQRTWLLHVLLFLWFLWDYPVYNKKGSHDILHRPFFSLLSLAFPGIKKSRAFLALLLIYGIVCPLSTLFSFFRYKIHISLEVVFNEHPPWRYLAIITIFVFATLQYY